MLINKLKVYFFKKTCLKYVIYSCWIWFYTIVIKIILQEINEKFSDYKKEHNTIPSLNREITDCIDITHKFLSTSLSDWLTGYFMQLNYFIQLAIAITNK